MSGAEWRETFLQNLRGARYGVGSGRSRLGHNHTPAARMARGRVVAGGCSGGSAILAVSWGGSGAAPAILAADWVDLGGSAGSSGGSGGSGSFGGQLGAALAAMAGRT